MGLPEEPLPSYLTRQGVKTIVHVNNTGLPRIKVSDYVVGSQLKQICRGDFCAERFEYTCSSGICDDIFPDGILLSGVEDIAQAALNESTFLLLHMGGSHGPNYFQNTHNASAHLNPYAPINICPCVIRMNCEMPMTTR